MIFISSNVFVLASQHINNVEKEVHVLKTQSQTHWMRWKSWLRSWPNEALLLILTDQALKPFVTSVQRCNRQAQLAVQEDLYAYGVRVGSQQAWQGHNKQFNRKIQFCNSLTCMKAPFARCSLFVTVSFDAIKQLISDWLLRHRLAFG